MATLNEYLEMRLQEWADWFKHGAYDKRLGYPSETLEYKLWRDGIIVQNNSGTCGTLPANNRAEEIELWVMDMQKHLPELSLVIRERYYSNRKIPIEAIARRNKMSRRGFEDKLRLARNFILSRLVLSRNTIAFD